MSQIVKLRRSSVSGQKPTNSNLQLGELALNTTDGKVYMAKSGSLGPSVEELISTNTVNTGSIYLTGDITGSIFTGSFKGDGSQLYNIPASGITGGISTDKIFSGSVSASISPDRGLEINTKTTITGSLTLAKTEDPDPSSLTTQATHLFVSASNNQTGEDLYIRQQDNKVKWKWIEGKLNTGILWGGDLSYSGSNIYIKKGSGIVINQRASATNEISPITTYVNWNDITASCLNLTSSLATYVGIDTSGSLYQQDNYFSVNQYRETIPLGMFNHTNKSTITSVANDVITAYDDVNQTVNFIQAFGPLKLEGLTLSPQSGNLQLTISAGQSYIYGGFYQQDPNNSSHKITSPVVTPQIARVRRDGHGSFIVDNNGGSFYNSIDSHYWDDGTGTLNTMATGDWQIQRVFFNPFTTRVHVYYGQSVYSSFINAKQYLATDPFVEAEYSSHQYVFLGYLIIKGQTNNLSDDNNNVIVQSGLFRNTVGSSGGVQTFATLHDLSDVDITTEANGDLLTYNSTTGKWTHGKQLNGNYQITGSLFTSGPLNIGDIPVYGDPLNPEILHVENSGSYNVANFIGNSDSFVQINVTNRNTGPNVSSDVVATADNGTEDTFFVDMGINSSTYTAGVVGEANDAYLINAGSDLYVGTISTASLNLFTAFDWENPQISVSGSKQIGFNTSSVSNGYVYEFSGSALFDHNAKVKGDLTVLGTITAEEIHTSYVTSSVLYKSGSTEFGNSLDDTHKFTGSVLIDNLLNVNRITPLSGPNVTVESSNLLVPNGGIFTSFNIGVSGSINATSISGSNITGSFIGDATGLINVPFHITGSDVDGNQYDKTFTKLHFDSDTGLNVSESAVGTAFISIGSHFKDIFVSGSPILSATGSDAFEIIPTGGVEITTSITDTNGNGYVKELNISTLNLSSSINSRLNTITGSFNNFTNSIQTFTSSVNTFTSSVNTHLTDLDNFTSSVVLTNQTSSMTVLSSSYAVTAAFALNVVNGGGSGVSDGAYAELNQTTPSTSWTFVHNLGQKYPIFQVFDTSDNVVIPTQITATDNNTATITFSSAQVGRVIASLGTGPGGMTQYFASATTWSLNHAMGTEYPIVTVYGSNKKIIYPQEIKSIDGNNIDVYFSVPVEGYLNVAKGGHIISGSLDLTQINLGGSGLISGSGQIANFGYAVTGSNTFTGNQIINGTLTVNKAKLGSTCLTLSTGNNQTIFDMYGFDGANFDYVIKNGTNMRGGMIMGVWTGSDVSYNETSTTDLGNTSDVTFYVTNGGILKANIASGTWQVEVMYRALKCS